MARRNPLPVAMAAAGAAGKIPWYVWVLGLGAVGYGIYRAVKGLLPGLGLVFDPKFWEEYGKRAAGAAGAVARKVIDEGKKTGKAAIKATEEVVKTGIDAGSEVLKHGYIKSKDLAIMIASDAATIMKLATDARSEAQRVASSQWKSVLQTAPRYIGDWKILIGRVEKSKADKFMGPHIKRNDFKRIAKYVAEDKIYRAMRIGGFHTLDAVTWSKMIGIYTEVMERKTPLLFENDIKMAVVYYAGESHLAVNASDYEWVVQYLVPLFNQKILQNVRSWNLPISGKGLALAIRMQVKAEDGDWKLMGKSLWDTPYHTKRDRNSWVGWEGSHPLGMERPEGWIPARMIQDMKKFEAYAGVKQAKAAGQVTS